MDVVNTLDRADFVATFGHVYESSSLLADAAWDRRPFTDAAALLAAVEATVDDLDEPGRLSLLRAHPALGTAGPMSIASHQEQGSAGLADLDATTRDRLQASVARYHERFGFPFILAVRGLTATEIEVAVTDRLEHDDAEELRTATNEVKRIAGLRILMMLSP